MKKINITLKTLISAIYELKKSVNQLTDAIKDQNLITKKEAPVKKDLNPTTTKSNQTSTSSYYAEKQAVERIYKAFMDQGVNPKHHQKMSLKLKRDWPALYAALSQLSVVRMNAKSNSTIWNYKH